MILSEVSSTAASFARHLDASPTPFHSVRECTRRLVSKGFVGLSERQPFALAKGSSDGPSSLLWKSDLKNATFKTASHLRVQKSYLYVCMDSMLCLLL